MGLHGILLTVDVVAIGCVGIAVIALALHPARRIFVPGFLLMGVAVVGALLRETLVIPRQYWLHARAVNVAVAILGFVLILRAWRRA